MTFDLTKILQSKREFRQRAAARPIEEKLAMLDALRERALAIRSENVGLDPSRDQTAHATDFPQRGKSH
jgi:hypothetical protein